MRDAPMWGMTRERPTPNEIAYPDEAPLPERLRFLVQYAALAPSSHNSQPWWFRIAEDYIDVHADIARWLRVTDPDQRELFVSVGCALENLRIAVGRFGLASEISYFPGGDLSLHVARLRIVGRDADGPEREAVVFNAIPSRHTDHGRYDGSPLADDERRALAACVDDADLQLVLLEDDAARRRIDALTVRADSVQFGDPQWRHELGHWIGQGPLGQSWLVAKMAKLAVSYVDFGRATARRDHDDLMSAPVFAIIAASSDRRALRVRAGQACERLWLTAEALGVRVHPMNQVLQVPPLSRELVGLLPGPCDYPQIGCRLGHAPRHVEPTPRRPVEEIIAR